MRCRTEKNRGERVTMQPLGEKETPRDTGKEAVVHVIGHTNVTSSKMKSTKQGKFSSHFQSQS